MSLKIKELPETERPYEKLELFGEKTLSNAELIAIVIKTGTREETSVQIAQRILKLSEDPQMGELNFLKNITLEELMQIKGIGKVKAIQIKAICELAIRMNKPANYRKIVVRNSSHLAGMLMQELRFEKKEHILLILLNNKNEILKKIELGHGGIYFVNVNIMDIIMEAVKIKAPRMILVHNHPSGDPMPSDRDIKITDKLYRIARDLGIELMDHLVIGNGVFRSVFVVLEKRVEEEKKKMKSKEKGKQNKIKICKLKNKLRIEKNKMYVSTKKGCQIRKELKL